MIKILFKNSNGHKFMAVINVNSKEEALEIFHKEISDVTIENVYNVGERKITVIPFGRR